MSFDKASPRPWHLVPHPEWGGSDTRVAKGPNEPWSNFGQICYANPHNAELIVKAVNSHDHLAAENTKLKHEFDELKQWYIEKCREEETCSRRSDDECEDCFGGDFKGHMKDRGIMGCPKCGYRLHARTESGRDYIRCSNCDFIQREKT